MGHYLLEQQESRRAIATEIALKAKALKVCEFHSHMTYQGDNWDAAEKLSLACQIGNAMWTKGEIEAGLFASRKEMTDAIKATIDEHCADGCTYPDCPNG